MASEKITNILEEIKSLTILELSDLVKAVEEEFGVSAAAPVGVVAAGAAAPAAEEKTEFDVILASFGAKKLDVIKVVRELTGLGCRVHSFKLRGQLPERAICLATLRSRCQFCQRFLRVRRRQRFQSFQRFAVHLLQVDDLALAQI